jgi:phospholipid/cholesterol/gamma-HCH transport system substrate-binding protein
MTFKTLSKTNENAAHLTENLLTITEEINDGKGTVGLLNDAEVARDLKNHVLLKISGRETAKATKIYKLVESMNNKDNVIGL